MTARAAAGMLLLLGTLAAAAPATARSYRNAEYGYAVELPRGLPLCIPDPATEHVHGITIWLDDGPAGCHGDETRPYISVSADHNATEYLDAESVSRWSCDPSVEEGTPRPTPGGLTIKGAHSVACAVDITKDWDDGAIVVIVAALGGKVRDTPGWDPRAPAVVYWIGLHTRPERFDADLARFRAVLKTVRLFEPGSERSATRRRS